MATIPPQRIQVQVDGNAMKVVALREAIRSTGGYVSLTGSESKDRWYIEAVIARAETFHQWLLEPMTFGGEDEHSDSTDQS